MRVPVLNYCYVVNTMRHSYMLTLTLNLTGKTISNTLKHAYPLNAETKTMTHGKAKRNNNKNMKTYSQYEQ